MIWSSVDDSLPDASGSYLVHVTGQGTSVQQTTIGYFVAESETWVNTPTFTVVTHWMPLPESPGKPVDPAAVAEIVNAALKVIPNSESEKRTDFLHALQYHVDYCWDCGRPMPDGRDCYCHRDD